MRKIVRMKGQTSLMPLDGKMGHVEIKRSQKLVLDAPVVLKMAVLPKPPRAGRAMAAPTGPEATTEAAAAATAAELAAAATNAAPGRD